MKRIRIALAAGLFILAPNASAQDDPGLVFGIYYRCSQALETQADTVMERVVAPIVQKHVDAGHLTGALWLAHEQGGSWRRVWALTGTDMGQMMGARASITAELGESNADEMAEFLSACPGHDDYIWNGLDLSTNNPDVFGAASLSAYHMCERTRETRADEIFTELLAPLYQKHIDAGHLASYGYYGHRAGGVFRRLETMSGPDHTTLLEMQGAIYGEATEIDPIAFQEFYDICRTHTDYMWNNPAVTN